MKVLNWFKKEWQETKVLFRSIPALPFMLFALSIVMMNLLAGTIIVNESWIALDAGILCSWVAFLGMDMLVKRFGPKASIKVTIAALLVNVAVCGVFAAVGAIASATGGYFALADYATGVQWWIVGISTLAFIVSGVFASLMHWFIRTKIKENNKDKFSAFAVCSWSSTLLGQFIDNIVFGFGFTYIAAQLGVFGMLPISVGAIIVMAATGCIVELLCEVLFSRLGFKISNNWKNNGVGQEYINLIDKK